jgi:hypothetical protein
MRNAFPLDDERDRSPVHPRLESERRLPRTGPFEVREMVWQVRCGGRPFTFLVRLYKKPQGPLYIVRGYTQKRRFSTVKEELERALESFRILP